MRGVPELCEKESVKCKRGDDDHRGSPPAEGVRVLDGGRDNELVLSLEVLDDDLVCVLRSEAGSARNSRLDHNASSTNLDVETLEVGDLVCVDSALVNGARGHLLFLDDAVGDGDAVIVVSESGSLVDDTSTRVRGNIGVADDLEGAIGVLLNSQTSVSQNRGEQRGRGNTQSQQSKGRGECTSCRRGRYLCRSRRRCISCPSWP